MVIICHSYCFLRVDDTQGDSVEYFWQRRYQTQSRFVLTVKSTLLQSCHLLCSLILTLWLEKEETIHKRLTHLKQHRKINFSSFMYLVSMWSKTRYQYVVLISRVGLIIKEGFLKCIFKCVWTSYRLILILRIDTSFSAVASHRIMSENYCVGKLDICSMNINPLLHMSNIARTTYA